MFDRLKGGKGSLVEIQNLVFSQGETRIPHMDPACLVTSEGGKDPS